MLENPNNFYFWCVSGIAILVGLDTVIRLWTERHRLLRENLNDEDRAIVWRIVLFIAFPLLVLMELESTIKGVENFGGQIKDSTYGFLFYELTPVKLAGDLLIPALFSGEFVVLLFALCLLPSLAFRPHPFLATLVGYTVVFVFAYELFVEPLLSLTAFASSKWTLALSQNNAATLTPLIAIHITLALAFLMLLNNKAVRMWFSELSRPEATDKLKAAIFEFRNNDNSPMLLSKLGILYEQAGMFKQAKQQLKLLESQHPGNLYTLFLKAWLAHSKRKFKESKNYFLQASDVDDIPEELKAHLLAAAGCSAFALGEIVSAINLSERALKYDESYLVARMVKVDALLKLGKRDQAAKEILIAVHSGLTLNLENKIPLDVDVTVPLLDASKATTRQDSKMFEVISKN